MIVVGTFTRNWTAYYSVTCVMQENSTGMVQYKSMIEHVLKLTIGIESLHESSNNKLFHIKLPHHNNCKYTWTSLVGKMHKLITSQQRGSGV